MRKRTRFQFFQSGVGTCSWSSLSFLNPQGSDSCRNSAALCGSKASPPGWSLLTVVGVGGCPGGCFGTLLPQAATTKQSAQQHLRKTSANLGSFMAHREY